MPHSEERIQALEAKYQNSEKFLRIIFEKILIFLPTWKHNISENKQLKMNFLLFLKLLVVI